MDKEDKVHIYNEILYSAVIRKEIMTFAATRRDLEVIILSEVTKRNTSTT